MSDNTEIERTDETYLTVHVKWSARPQGFDQGYFTGDYAYERAMAEIDRLKKDVIDALRDETYEIVEVRESTVTTRTRRPANLGTAFIESFD